MEKAEENPVGAAAGTVQKAAPSNDQKKRGAQEGSGGGKEGGPEPKKRKKQAQNPTRKNGMPSTKAVHGSTIDKAMNKEFGNLDLDSLHVQADIGKTRVRNHVNPLSSQFRMPIKAPDWKTAYADPTRPLIVDIGCAAGRFSLQMTTKDKWNGYNHLGLEIREPLVVRANAWAQKMNLTNVHYISCSANSSLDVILSTYPGDISYVAVQFPDPHFKRKTHKRRVVNAELLAVLSKHMKQDSVLFMQSDIEEVAAQMRDRGDVCPFFDRNGPYSDRDPVLVPGGAAVENESLWTKEGHRALGVDGKAISKPAATKKGTDATKKGTDGGSETAPTAASPPKDYGDWLLDPNIFGVPTEREVQNTALNLPIYRCLHLRNDHTGGGGDDAATAGVAAEEVAAEITKD